MIEVPANRRKGRRLRKFLKLAGGLTGGGEVDCGPSSLSAFLARAEFCADAQTFSNSQILNTAAEGVTVGSFQNIEDTAGTTTLAVISPTDKVWRTTANPSNTWNKLGLVGQDAISLALGVIALAQVKLGDDDQGYLNFGFADSASGADADRLFEVWTGPDAGMNAGSGTGAAPATPYQFHYFVYSYLPDTYHKLAVICGGFNSSGEPYYSGATKSNYGYGFWGLYHNGTKWKLIGCDPRQNPATGYARLMVINNANADNVDVDRIVVPDYDASAAQASWTNVSYFVDSNGTSLDAYTPEVGGAWAETNGQWEINTNRARRTGSNPGGPSWIATLDTGEADVWLHGKITFADNGGPLGFIVRYQDNNNLLLCEYYPGGNSIAIYQWNGSSWSSKASASVSLGASSYHVAAYAEGTTVAIIIGPNRARWTAATPFQTETSHGIRHADWANASSAWDHWSCTPVASSAFETTLEAI